MGHPIHFVFGSGVGFSGTADRTAPFPVGSNPRWWLATIFTKKNQTALSLMYVTYTDHTLLSNTIMTVDAYDRRLDAYFAREGN